MAFFAVSATSDVVAVAGIVVVAVVVTLLSHNIDDFPSDIDSMDDCDKPDTVNAETVDAVLSILVIVPMSVSRMNDEFSDVVAEFG